MDHIDEQYMLKHKVMDFILGSKPLCTTRTKAVIKKVFEDTRHWEKCLDNFGKIPDDRNVLIQNMTNMLNNRKSEMIYQILFSYFLNIVVECYGYFEIDENGNIVFKCLGLDTLETIQPNIDCEIIRWIKSALLFDTIHVLFRYIMVMMTNDIRSWE